MPTKEYIQRQKDKQIGNDLLEAYKGRYEDEFGPFTDKGITALKALIRTHTAKERLETYLTWNGILGYTNRIWELSQGEL